MDGKSEKFVITGNNEIKENPKGIIFF